MTESNILANIATIKHYQEEVLHNTKGEYMNKELNTHAGSVTINQPPRGSLFNTKTQYIKESNTHALNGIINQDLRLEVLNAKG